MPIHPYFSPSVDTACMKKYLTGKKKSAFNPGPQTRVVCKSSSCLGFSADDEFNSTPNRNIIETM